MEKQLINEIRPRFTWRVFQQMGSYDSDLKELISELIDNPIPTGNNSVNVNVEIFKGKKPQQSYITVSDDGIGINSGTVSQIFQIGESPNKDKLLMSEMGVGMKIAIFGLGKLEYIATKEFEKSEYICTPHFHSGQPYKDSDLAQFNSIVNTNPQIDTESGTIIKINECDEMIPHWNSESQFNKFVDYFNGIYIDFLGSRLNLKIKYTNQRKNTHYTWEKNCKGYQPILSHPKKMLDVDLGLGTNELVIDGETISVPDYPDVSVKLSAGYKARLSEVKSYFEKTKNPIYNPDIYAISPYTYTSQGTGIILKKRGKVLNFGSDLEVKSSRAAAHYITLEIDGIDSTGVKKEIKKGNQRDAVIEAVTSRLKKEGFHLRVRAGYNPRSEKEDHEKFREHLISDSKLCSEYGINNPKQIKIYVRNSVGEADIVIWNDSLTKVTAVGEVKKDRPDAESVRQLFGYMAFYSKHNKTQNVMKGFVVCQGNAQPTFDEQVECFKFLHSDLQIDYFNSNKLYS